MVGPDPYRKADEKKDWVATIGQFVPFFGGYLEAKRRHETDKILREHIAKKVEAGRTDVDSAIQDLAEAGKLGALGKLDPLKDDLQGLASKIRYADYGHAGFFNTVKVTNDDLAELYQFDLNLLEAAEDLKARCGRLREIGNDEPRIKDEAKALKEAIRRVAEYFGTRKDAILGLA